MADTFTVTIREDRGTRNARRSRNAGTTPAILYGHGKENVCLAVPADELSAAIRQGTRVVTLEGAVNDTALIREVQWDAFGIDVLHIDLTRVGREEKIEVMVSVELRGDAPGTKAGGIINHVTHQIQVECPAMNAPDKVEANINSLEVGDVITAGELTLPEGSVLTSDGEAIIVQCVEAAPDIDEEEAADVSVEPEVIGRKPEEESEE